MKCEVQQNGSAQQEAADRCVQFVKETAAGFGDGGSEDTVSSSDKSTAELETEELSLTIGNTPVRVRWDDNESVKALKELVINNPLTIHIDTEKAEG